MLSEDDLDIAELDDQELAIAWDLWFDLAQSTNEEDPPYTHGVFVSLRWNGSKPEFGPVRTSSATGPAPART
jgi:hypothetical protein